MICRQLQRCMEDEIQSCKREESCIEYSDKRSTVSCEEKKKKYHLNNDLGVKIRKYKMDGGIVNGEQGVKICDNLLVAYGKNCKSVIFVELKGKALKHAVKQVSRGIKEFASDMKNCKVYARIVHTQGVPRIQNSGDFVDLHRAVRSRGGNLKLDEWILKEDLSGIDITK